MCGIVGVRRAWRDEPARAAAALAALAWRGPDGQRLVEVGGWRLGVARLSISDPSAGQPIVCPRTGRAVALNGAITSARGEWPRYAGQARTRNDAELLLLRLAARGERALGDMSGPYAFAIVDPADDGLWLGRDPEGEKPLWVVRDRGRVVAFASTVAALRVLGVPVELPPEERARLLRYGFCLDPRAPGELELASLPPGVAVQRPGAAWRRVETARGRGTDGGLGARVDAASARCADAEVAVGISLSGGVDSACIAAALGGRGLPAYQFRATGEPDAERERAARVAAHTGQVLRPVDAGPEVLHALPQLTRCAGLPLGDPSVLAAAALARQAAADGVRVLLSGEGADDLLLGYRRHRAAAWLPRRGTRWAPRPSGLATGALARLLRAWRAPRPYDALLEVAPPGFVARALEVRAVALPDGGERTSLERARRVDRALYLRRDLLPKLDVATLAAGVEGRCPFLDPDVVAWAEGAGARSLLGKRPLRAAFAPRLPAGFLAQPKVGFALPLDRWLREDDFLADVLVDPRTLARPHVRRDGLRAMLDLHRRGGARLGHALYVVAALELFDRIPE